MPNYEAVVRNATALSASVNIIPARTGYTEEDIEAAKEEGYQQGKIDGDVAKYASVIRFTEVAFPDGHELELNAQNLIEFPQFSKATGVRKVTLKELSLGKQYGTTNFLYTCESVEEVVLIDGIKITNANYMCTNAYGLRRITGAMDMTSVTSNNMFTGCPNLEEIRFVPNTIGATIDLAKSPNLSDASIQSIIDALKDLTGATTQTLTFHATVGGKLTDAQKATITAKNWTLAY